MSDGAGVDYHGTKHGQALEDTPLLGSVDKRDARKGKYRSFDEALEGVGVGAFHLVLVLVSGWAIASDSVEIQCISFVTPKLDRSNSNSSTGVTQPTCRCTASACMHTHTHTHSHTHTHMHTHTHTHTGLCATVGQDR